MRNVADERMLSVEQRQCLKCGCDNCHRLFNASTRFMQDINSRTKAFEVMQEEEIDLQKRMLFKQLSTVVELLGTDFILNRSSRNRA